MVKKNEVSIESSEDSHICNYRIVKDKESKNDTFVL